MDVLQHPLGNGFRADPQIFLVLLLPALRQLLYGNLPGHQGLLQLVAHHDVKAVGQLVRLNADGARLHPVDGPVEVLQAHVL